MPSILIFGATGYIGVPLIKALKQAHPEWPITAFVRPSRSIETVKSELGVEKVATGEFHEFEKIRLLSREYEIVVNAGNSFTDEPVAAICTGLKERSPEAKGKLIHISGGGNFLDMGTTGAFNPNSKVWSDGNEDDIKLINEQMFNGPSDTVVLDAGKNNSVETHIICTGIVYGNSATGSRRLGVAYGGLIANAKTLGFVPYVGDGSAVVAPTHVLDAVAFLTRIIEVAASGPAKGSAYERWYNVNTERRVAWKDLAGELAKALYKKGVFKIEDAKSVPVEQAGDGEFKYLVAANMLMDGPRAAGMGFVPSQPGILEQISRDLEIAEL